uniref:Uncharacterized protein LOC112818244 isoform X2 n=1 Tax=Callorhinus ursinus TaxID=34884 RepID=A0A3Q7PYN8_CALUR|nr:uncharacterized protein LOC112818244 isoform X2 [Callorhinus ursinus]
MRVRPGPGAPGFVLRQELWPHSLDSARPRQADRKLREPVPRGSRSGWHGGWGAACARSSACSGSSCSKYFLFISPFEEQGSWRPEAGAGPGMEYNSNPKEHMLLRDYISYWKDYIQGGYSSPRGCLYLKDWHLCR